MSFNDISAGNVRCNTIFRTPNFAETILANNEVKAPITTPGAAISTTSEALLASTEDDYGTSYYFRGAVKNNYVQFANKCWRIVRIVGDGSVKLVLHNDNSDGSSSPCSSSNNSTDAALINGSAFNQNERDNMSVGLMYGTINASDYASTHANINKSTILTNLEAWYENNLTSYENKFADTIWCNDKSTVSEGLGYGTNVTNDAAYNRIYLTKTPTLICPNDNNGGKLSKFTVSDTTNGNGSLIYKIGLLTADEIAFAGMIYDKKNDSTYLRENANDTWYTLTPYYFRNAAFVLSVMSSSLNDDEGYGYVAYNHRTRPAISLVSSIAISGGSGTSEDPYIVN